MNRKKMTLALATCAIATAGVCCTPLLADTTVNFAWQYQDYGGTAHPLQSIPVTFFDALTAAQFAGPITTDANGQLQLATAYNNTDSSGNLEIQPGLTASIAGVGAAYSGAGAINPYIYFPAGNGVYLASLNQTTNYLNISFTNSTDASKTFEVLEFVKFMHDFYANAGTYNANLPVIRINYSSTNAGGSSMGGGIMTLGARSWGNIDVILHEYGHHVAEYNNVEAAGVGLAHSFGQDNISGNNGGRNYGNQNGSQVAWQEGIATYFEQVAIREGNLAGAFPGIPADATNSAYDNYQPQAAAQRIVAGDFSFNASIDSLELQIQPFAPADAEDDDGNPIGGNPPIQTRGQGEGDELSVMRTLWDFENNVDVENYARAGQTDYSNYGGKKIFTLMQNVATNKGTFYGFWKTITADVRTAGSKPLVGLTAADPDAQAVSRLGMTLEQNAISSIPLTFGFQPTDKPTVRWQEQNNMNSTLFEVLIYSADWKTLMAQSPQIAAGVDMWTSTVSLPVGTYEYEILNNPVLATAGDLTNIYNWYWSGDAVISTPEPGTLALAAMGVGVLLMRKRRATA